MKVADELSVAAPRVQSASEELANAVSHGIGFVASLIASPILLLAAAQRNSSGFFIGSIIFAATMSILYFSSTLYHAWPETPGKSFWRLIDHSAIFLLIAGTYTPFGLGPLRNNGGLIMLGVVWSLAIFGVTLKATRVTAAIPLWPLLWLVGGGILYTTGLIFFLSKRLPYAHFIWHLFVLAGTSCHFMAVISCAG